MSEPINTKKISKFLSFTLRHKPEDLGITLDNEGWTDVNILISKMQNNGFEIDQKTLDYVVETNNKKRFGYNDDKTKIRANQGHSIEIDHGFKAIEPPEFLYHGTATRNLESILKSGIDKRNRHHVHLSADRDTAQNVGQRHGKPIILIIESLKMHHANHQFFLSENNVWLTEFIPVEYIRE